MAEMYRVAQRAPPPLVQKGTIKFTQESFSVAEVRMYGDYNRIKDNSRWLFCVVSPAIAIFLDCLNGTRPVFA